MSGLASRWATDDSLVKEAQLQDKKTHTSTTRTPRSHAATEQKKISKAETSVSGKPLISRWADADEETGSSPKSANIPQLNTPPHSRDGLESPKRRNKNNRHKTKKNINSEPENEVLPKISDAGKSLASRLGAIDILDAKHQSQRQPQNYQQQPHSHTQPLAPKRAPPKGPSAYRQRYAAAEPDSRNDWVDEEEVEGEDDELPPMTSAGQSLAARLGMFEQKKHPSNPPASNNKARQAKQTASKSAGKYLTPDN